MTCKIEGGEKWGYQPSSLYSTDHFGVESDLGLVEIKTGGMDSGTLIWMHPSVTGLEPVVTGKVKTWIDADGFIHGYGIYGNGASVSLLESGHPLHLKITNLPKVQVPVE